MNDSHKTELLSSYLDNEISAVQQAEIEQLLETDPQARQILEELSQLGDLLRDQPQPQVRTSFSADVMNRVRQQPAFGSSTPIPAAAEHDPAGQPQESEHAHVVLAKHDNGQTSGDRYRRPLVWGALAAAAALLVLAYPLGLFNFFNTSPVDNQIVVEEENNGNGGDLIANGENETQDTDHVTPDQLVGQPEQETQGPDDTPREHVDPNAPRVPPGQIVESNNVPRTNQGEPIPAPFVAGDFTAEDEKILRLLESLVLVKIECTPETANAREFDKILKKYKIKLAEKATPRREANAPAPETEVYYIEASVEQAEAVLNEVNSRNTEFTSITMRTETLQTKNTLGTDPAEKQAAPQATPGAESDPPSEEQQPARVPDEAASPPANQGRGSFAQKFQLETPAQLAALRNKPGQPPSASNLLPFLQGQSDLDTILGNSPVEAEHLVRMLVVIDTVKPKEVE